MNNGGEERQDGSGSGGGGSRRWWEKGQSGFCQAACLLGVGEKKRDSSRETLGEGKGKDEEGGEEGDQNT